MNKYLQWFWKYSVGFRIKVLSYIFLSIGGICFSLLFVETTKILINNTINERNIAILLVTELILFKVIQLFCEQSDIYLRTLTRSEMENVLEYKMFCNLTDSKIQAKNKFHTGDEIYRLSSDVGIIAESMSFTLPILLCSIIQLIVTWVYLMTMQPILTIILGIISPIIIIIGYFYTQLLIPASRKVRQKGSKVNEYIQEHLQHHELITLFEQNKFVQSNVRCIQIAFLQALKSKIRLTVSADSLTEIGFAVSYLLVLIWGVYGIVNNSISYGELLVFIQLIGQLQRPLFIIKDQYPSLISSFASVERLIEITSLPKEICNNKFRLNGTVGIKFKNVYFRYSKDKKWILANFSYDFKPGTITAIFGKTGIGKSTLAKMILGIYSPVVGTIELYNDINKEKYFISPNIRCNCVYVPQGNSLISGTIRYNLLFGNLEATEEQIREALHFASADFVFSDFPNGLETIIGEKGFGISEGQAQRIAIARAYLRDSSIIIMDEPTSALDPNTEKDFLTRLTNNYKKKTIIIITHKIETCNYVSNVITINSCATTEINPSISNI